MSHSVLLQLARDSIQEVFQAKSTIDRNHILQEHPLLHEKITVTINLYQNEELRGSYKNKNSNNSLLSNIIIGAKKAAFEDEETPVLTTSQYLHCEVEILLFTENGTLQERDSAILSNN